MKVKNDHLKARVCPCLKLVHDKKVTLKSSIKQLFTMSGKLNTTKIWFSLLNILYLL